MRSIRCFFLFVLLIGMAIPTTGMAEVVYMKSGEIVKGNIIEKIPDQLVRIMVYNGYTRILSYNDIDRIIGSSGELVWKNPVQLQLPPPPPPDTSRPHEFRINAGVLAGPDYMNQRKVHSGSVSYSPGQLGLMVGGIVEGTVQDFLAFRSGAVFSRRAAFNYLAIPADFKLQFSIGPESYVYALCGGNFGFLVNSAGNKNVKGFDGGIDFGIGLDMPGEGVPGESRSTIPFIEAVYYFGFSNIGNLPGSVTAQNRGFDIRVGMKFPVYSSEKSAARKHK